ncbi:MAG: rhomboid family intramembrane serine protease [Deltaproteobacteria bacterium]|nr:rhomboid family intramembrane serine protease [Deltaproteobacteria bacterium]
MVILFENLHADKVNEYELVLRSSGIAYDVNKGAYGWNILVGSADYERALNTIEKYLRENPVTGEDRQIPPLHYQKTFSGLVVCVMLVLFYMLMAMGTDNQAFMSTYGSSAFNILHGELYRTVTSLMVHANVVHLACNVVGIAVFGTAVCSITGAGVGWFLILITGIVGNLMNAFLYQKNHISIGSSTAIFGAIGILAGYQFLRKTRQPEMRIKAWIPLAGGLALLAILGSGKYSDLTAHLFGFVSGIVMGIGYNLVAKTPPRRLYQIGLLFIGSGLIAGSWIIGMGIR